MPFMPPTSFADRKNSFLQDMAARYPNSHLARRMLSDRQQMQQLYAGSNNDPSTIPSFAEGGMMGEEGQAVRPGMPMNMPTPGPDEPTIGAQPPQIEGKDILAQAQQFAAQHPQQLEQIKQVIGIAMQRGELTPQELNMAVQLAKTALGNPASWPQVRQFAIQNGLGDDQSLPQQFDAGLLFVLLVAGQSMGSKAAAPMGDMMSGQPPSPNAQPQSGLLPSYEDGGHTGEKAHLAQLHPNEYVIPKDVLLHHGKKTFDKMIEQARTPPNER